MQPFQPPLFSQAEDAQVSPRPAPVIPEQTWPSAGLEPVAPQSLRAADGYLNQPVEAFFMLPQSLRLTALSRRLWIVLLKYAHDTWANDPAAVWFRAPLARLSDDARYDNANSLTVRARLKEQMSTVVTWGQSPTQADGGTIVWEAAQLLGGVRIVRAKNLHLFVEWTYPDNIRDRLRNFKIWTSVHLETVTSFNTYPGLALYLLGCRYLTSPKRLTMRISIADAIPLLAGTPSPDKKKKGGKPICYRYFRRDVVERGLEELHKSQDAFRLELITHLGSDRVVSEIQFLVVPNEVTSCSPVTRSANPVDAPSVQRLIDIGVAQDKASSLFTNTDPEAIEAALLTTEQRMQSTTLPALERPAAYLFAELQSGRASASIAQPVPPSKGPDIEAIALEVRRRYDNTASAAARALYLSAPQTDKSVLIARFEREALPSAPAVVRTNYQNSGLDRRICSEAFYRWVLREHYVLEPTDLQLVAFSVSGKPIPLPSIG
jgi:hypothetical protein